MKGTTIGIDIAKNVFEVYVEDETGQVVERRRLSRKKLLPWFANRTPAVVGLEACGGAHYWGRELDKLGHTVRLIAPQYVKPWVQTNKSDRADARAICRAVQEPGMRVVGVASEEAQAVQAVHRVRTRLLRQRTALVNQLRGLLLEYGVAIPQGLAPLRNALPLLLAQERWTEVFRHLVEDQLTEWQGLDTRIAGITQQLERVSQTNPACVRLQQIPGVGPLSASALWVKLTGQVYTNGRHLAAALGLVPKHTGTGGKIQLGPISKRGDRYLRRLLIHGARSVITHRRDKPDPVSRWVGQLVDRRGMNKAVVALANKNARVAFAVLSGDQAYDATQVCGPV